MPATLLDSTWLTCIDGALKALTWFDGGGSYLDDGRMLRRLVLSRDI